MDALLLVSFGGPEGPEDVMPFLENVTRGRNVPRERLEEVAEHYHRFGGRSPINDQCRELKAAIEKLVDVPVYWGNRNWPPYLADTVAQMKEDGITSAAAFVTSAYSGYSSSGQYQEDIDRARAAVPGAPEITKIPPYCLEPQFVDAFVSATQKALAQLPEARLVFTAHSVPLAQPGRAEYDTELHEVAVRVHEASGAVPKFDLVYQSRSGPPSQPWLEPDILDHLRTLYSLGVRDVVLVPIGFVSDHMEVIYDLDVEARDLAAELGMRLARAGTPGVALAPLAAELFERTRRG
ncbi:ferrochelatase [Actinocorallia sp. A-T 12471]|uniref:ferrochelatase n=1 Tax=Actinocorallia sp. A-T 12471 TaxID=3089813 RepID=UPI0029D21242|nr:ferrochelatase [Actinocorallia sp. A-T 12471]MDX6739763.1 ferrochelatase [Actinocorallia sp. A-T 12471]